MGPDRPVRRRQAAQPRVNRWAFKPEIGVSKALGPLVLEVAPAVVVFTDNPEFFGDRVREQTPIHAVQGHAVHRFGPPLNRDRQSNLRIDGTVALSLNRHNSIKLYASTNVVTRFGGDFDTVGMAWQYRWGGGL